MKKRRPGEVSKTNMDDLVIKNRLEKKGQIKVAKKVRQQEEEIFQVST